MATTSTDNNRAPRVLISGGGTGGHIFPALAIAGAIKRLRPEAEFLFVGAEGRMEMERVPAAGYRIVGLPVAGFDRRRLWRNFKVLWKLMVSMRRAKRILREFRPDIAIGVGGYASGPMLKEAQRNGIATLLQEQNSYAGVTNKLLGGKADLICVAYEGMERFFPADRIKLTGNPVRANLLDATLDSAEARRKLGFDPAKPLVVVTGGSLGARTINQSMAAALPLFRKAGVCVLWQTGKLYYKEFAPLVEGDADIKAVEFITDMNAAYSAADLVVARAGASTISELQLLGLPVILVPSPNVAEDHQRKNAMALVKRGAAVMIEDADAPAKLGEAVVQLLADADARRRMAEAVKEMALEHSDDTIAGYALEIIAKRQKS